MSPTTIEPRSGCGAGDAADEEVAALVLLGVLVHRDAELQAPSDASAGRPAVERRRGPPAASRSPACPASASSTLPSAAVTDHGRPDRAAALADDGAARRPRRRAARPRRRGRARAVDGTAGSTRPRPAPAGQSADQRQAGQRLVGELDEAVDRERPGVGEQDGDRVVGVRGRAGRPRRAPSGARSTSRWKVRTRAPGSTAAQTRPAGTISTPRPAPMTPAALQPMTAAAPSASQAALQRGGDRLGVHPADEDAGQIGLPPTQRLQRRARWPPRRARCAGRSPTASPSLQSAIRPSSPRLTERSQPAPESNWRARSAHRDVRCDSHDPSDHPRARSRAARPRHCAPPGTARPSRPRCARTCSTGCAPGSRASPASSASTRPCCPRWSAPCWPGTTWSCSASAGRARPGWSAPWSSCSTRGRPSSPGARSATTRTAPVCRQCRGWHAEPGDDLPIGWRHRSRPVRREAGDARTPASVT